MSSILSRGPKQIPSDGQYFVSITGTATLNLLYFNNDVLLGAPTPLSTFVRAGRYFHFVDWEIAPIPDDAACAFRFALLHLCTRYACLVILNSCMMR